MPRIALRMSQDEDANHHLVAGTQVCRQLFGGMVELRACFRLVVWVLPFGPLSFVTRVS